MGEPGGRGSIDATGELARFSIPLGITNDGQGNLFVADDTRIRKVTLPAGDVTTVAGNLVPGTGDASGSLDGIGVKGRMQSASGVAISNGVIYFVELDGVVRAFHPDTNEIRTIAGQPYVFGSHDDIGPFASFRYPNGLAAGPDGMLYVADGVSCTIRRVDPGTGAVTTLVGSPGQCDCTDGTGPNGHFEFDGTGIVGMAFDKYGSLYVSDAGSDTIRKVEPASGTVSTFVGFANQPFPWDGNVKQAYFQHPQGLAIADPYMFVADGGNYTIREVALPTAQTITVAGLAAKPGGENGIGSAAHFSALAGLSVVGGFLYIEESDLDANLGIVRKMDLSTYEVSDFAGKEDAAHNIDGLLGTSKLTKPGPLAFFEGYLYVGEPYALRMIDLSTLQVSLIWGIGQSYTSPTGIGYLAGLAIDPTNGYIFGADAGANRIFRLTLGTNVPALLVGPARGYLDGEAGVAQLDTPIGVAVDAGGYFYFADSGNHRIRKEAPAYPNVVSTLAGSGVAATTDGLGPNASFNTLLAIAISPNQTMWILEESSAGIAALRTVDLSNGQVSTVAHLDFIEPDLVQVGYPQLIALSDDELLLSDPTNGTIRRWTPALADRAPIFIGTAAEQGNIVGVPADVRLNHALGMARGASGLYLGNTQENAVLWLQ